jgi:hypothetical protein
MGRNWARILGTKAAVRTELIPVHRKAVDALDEAKD